MSVDNFDVLFAKSLSKGGGGSGTDNYNELSNKPQINGNALTGNKTGANLGLQDAITSESKLSSDLVDDTGAENLFVSSTEKSTWGGKQDPATTLSGYGITDAYTKTETGTQITNAIGALDVSSVGGSGKYISAISETDGKISATAETMDTTPTSGSEKAVTSGAVYTALASKQDALTTAQLDAVNSGITAEKLTADETALGEVINGGAAGTKNLFDMSGAQTFDVTGYGVHCTINKSTGVITLDGTNQDKKCTGSFNIKVSDSTSLGLIAGTVYKLTCDGYTTSDTTIGIYVYTSGVTPEAQFDTYNHTELAWNSSWEQSNGFRLFVRSGTVVNNITLRPMLCRKTLYDANPEFEPYAPAKTNVEITPALVELVDGGAKNVLQFDAVSRASYNGVDFTYNADGSVTVNAASSASDNAFCYLNLDGSNVDVKALCDGNHVISGCPTNSSGVTLRIMGTGYTTVTDSGDGATIPAYSGENVIRVAVYVAKNGTPSNIKVKPMICTKTAWDISHKFVPYCPSMAEMYEMILALQNGTRSAPALAKSAEPEVEPETGEEEMR